MWLRSFVDSGDNLTTDVTMSLYKREFLAGRVELGGNEDSSATGGHSMYTVIVVPAENPIPDPPLPPARLRVKTD